MNGKEGNYLEKKTYNVEIIYINIFYLGLLRRRLGEMLPKHLMTDAQTLKLHLVNLKSILSRYDLINIYVPTYLFFIYLILDLQEEAGSSPQTFNSDLTVEITVQKPEVEWMLFETTRNRKWMLFEVLIPYV